MDAKRISKQIYSKQKRFEFGNKPSWYLANLLDSKTKFNLIPSLKDKNGKILRSEEDKMKEFVIFYKKLYDSSNPDENRITAFLV